MNWAWFGGIETIEKSQSAPVTNGRPSANEATARRFIVSASSADNVRALFFNTDGGVPPPRRRSAYSCADKPAEIAARQCSIGDNPNTQPGGTIHGMWTMLDDAT